MKHHVTAILVVVTVLPLWGCKDDAGSSLTATPPRTTTVPFSFGWDVEANAIVHPSARTADFFWNNVSETQRLLITQGAAKAAIVAGKSFDEITAKYIQRTPLEPISILQSDKEKGLEPGTVVIFQTAEGNIGKLVVERYRSLHDLDFPEAAAFTDHWQNAVKERANTPEGHIQVKWSLYR